jgi:hypothetical protein
MSKINKNLLIDVIGVIDSYHDMYNSIRLDSDSKTTLKEILEDDNFIDYFFNFEYDNNDIKLLLDEFKISKIKNFIVGDNNKKEKIIKNVNDKEYRNEFKNIIYNLIVQKKIDISTISLQSVEEIIILNYKMIFMSAEQNNNFNDLTNSSDENKIIERNNKIELLSSNIKKIRIPLFHIIKIIKENNSILYNLDSNDKIEANLNKIKLLETKLKNIVKKISLPFDIVEYIKIMQSTNKNVKNNKIEIKNGIITVNIFSDLSNNECLKKILEYLINNNYHELIEYFENNKNLTNKMFNNLKIVSAQLKSTTKYFWTLNNLLTILQEKFSKSNRDEFIKNKKTIINRTKEEILCEMINYILKKFNNDIKENNLILDSIYAVINNIKNNLEIINSSTNYTYPIGVLLQDNKSYISIIDDLYFKKIYPVHHDNFDQSNTNNLSVPESYNNEILQDYNANYEQIQEGNITFGVDIKYGKDKIEHIDIANNLYTLYNLNLDYNNTNDISINYFGIRYELSCTDINNEILDCDDKDVLFNNKKEYITKNKIITFSNINLIKDYSNNNTNVKINGKCSKNSVELLGIFINLLFKFKNNDLIKNNNNYSFKNATNNNYILSLSENIILFTDNSKNDFFSIIIEKTSTIDNFIKSQNNFNLLVTIILGCKRFGDWYAQELAKKNYLFVKTDDFWANIYGMINGTPTIFSFNQNYQLFNYLPDNKLIDDFSNGKSNFIIPRYDYFDYNKYKTKPDTSNLDKKKFIYDNNEIIYKPNFNNIHLFNNYKIPLLEEEFGFENKTPNDSNPLLSRYYFHKYLKYKKKYIDKKKKLMLIK